MCSLDGYCFHTKRTTNTSCKKRLQPQWHAIIVAENVFKGRRVASVWLNRLMHVRQSVLCMTSHLMGLQWLADRCQTCQWQIVTPLVYILLDCHHFCRTEVCILDLFQAVKLILIEWYKSISGVKTPISQWTVKERIAYIFTNSSYIVA